MITAGEISDFIGKNLIGDSGAIVSQLVSFPPKVNEISFISKNYKITKNLTRWDGVVIADTSLKIYIGNESAVIFSDEPKYDLSRIYWEYFDKNQESIQSYKILENNAIVGDSVRLGSDVVLDSGCVLLGDIEIGNGSRIGCNVVIKNKVYIGKNVTVLNGSCIGEDPFSFGFSSRGESILFPSFAGVVIKDNSRIGNNSTISKGVFSDTEIGENVIIDDLSNIGNAVKVGKNSKIMASCSISGRVTIEENCFIGRASSIRQGISIGRNSIVGMGSVVISNVPNDVTVFGVPSKHR
jgi:UDP-3-O-[3-hydroxymyristoyl] glucosamine N-acyltransferase